jgi:hypothetical protein
VPYALALALAYGFETSLAGRGETPSPALLGAAVGGGELLLLPLLLLLLVWCEGFILVLLRGGAMGP